MYLNPGKQVGTQNKDFGAVLPMDSATALVCGEDTFNLSVLKVN